MWRGDAVDWKAGPEWSRSRCTNALAPRKPLAPRKLWPSGRSRRPDASPCLGPPFWPGPVWPARGRRISPPLLSMGTVPRQIRPKPLAASGARAVCVLAPTEGSARAPARVQKADLATATKRLISLPGLLSGCRRSSPAGGRTFDTGGFGGQRFPTAPRLLVARRLFPAQGPKAACSRSKLSRAGLSYSAIGTSLADRGPLRAGPPGQAPISRQRTLEMLRFVAISHAPWRLRNRSKSPLIGARPVA